MNDTGKEAQHRLRESLSVVVNAGADTRAERVLSLFLPWVVYLKAARKVVGVTADLSMRDCTPYTDCRTIRVKPYDGVNPAVLEMKQYLEKYLANDLAGAYVHGSLGTGEEIAYSDFDALVVLKDEVLRSTKALMRVTSRLRYALKIMYKFDPLQHHGWFMMTEYDLRHYDENYFPTVLFRYSKSLFEEKGCELTLCGEEGVDPSDAAFLGVARSIQSRLAAGRFPQNIFQLKSLLSEFMLLPALFLQAREGTGVFKKDSFPVVEGMLDTKCWSSMHDASSIRDDWNYSLSPTRKRLLTLTHPVRKYLAHYFAPQIPDSINKRIHPGFYEAMAELAGEMIEQIDSR